MQERRKYERITAAQSAVVVELRYAEPSAPEVSRTLFCSTADLSTHGLRLRLENEISVGTPLRVTVIFQLPSRHFKHIGRIRWVVRSSEAEYLLGVEFLPKTRPEMSAWRDFLDATFPGILRGLIDPA